MANCKNVKLDSRTQPEEVAAARERYANWPGVFAQMKFYIDDGEFQCAIQFDGEALRKTGVSREDAAVYRAEFEIIYEAVNRTMHQLASTKLALNKLAEILGGETGEGDDQGDGDKGSDSGESGEQHADQSAGVSGDS